MIQKIRSTSASDLAPSASDQAFLPPGSNKETDQPAQATTTDKSLPNASPGDGVPVSWIRNLAEQAGFKGADKKDENRRTESPDSVKSTESLDDVRGLVAKAMIKKDGADTQMAMEKAARLIPNDEIAEKYSLALMKVRNAVIDDQTRSRRQKQKISAAEAGKRAKEDIRDLDDAIAYVIKNVREIAGDNALANYDGSAKSADEYAEVIVKNIEDAKEHLDLQLGKKPFALQDRYRVLHDAAVQLADVVHLLEEQKRSSGNPPGIENDQGK